MSKEKEISEEYASSLADLTVNSKPLINMLTILAEEYVEHAGVIVDTVEKHLEKVHSDIKLPVLYLVDSIIKNVGGAYTAKFAGSIVNMFTRTFKQVDEKTRSQMFKLRETWHDVFPAAKLYQLDVKVNLIDPAWPLREQPPQSNIHVNPNFLKKPVATTSVIPVPTPADEEAMRTIVAKKQQELLMLQKKKIEMELEKTRRQLEMTENMTKKPLSEPHFAGGMPVAMVSPTQPAAVAAPMEHPPHTPVKQRLGPPVSHRGGPGGRIAPVSTAMLAAARRDPRLARNPHPPPASTPHHQQPQPHNIAPNVFDIKPLERVTKRKNVITIDVRPDGATDRRDPRRRDPRVQKRNDVDERRKNKEKRNERQREEKTKKNEEKRKEEDKKEAKRVEDDIDANNFDINSSKTMDDYITQIPDAKRINKLPPIPKLNRHEEKKEDAAPSPTKKRKETAKEKRKKKENASANDGEKSDSQSPEKKNRNKDAKLKKQKEPAVEVEDKEDQDLVAFKELKNYHKERYMRRNKEASASPDKLATNQDPSHTEEPANIPAENKDVDLRVLPVLEPKAAAIGQKRSSTEMAEVKAKKSKQFDILFGNEDVDLRQLPQVEETAATNDEPIRSPKLVAESPESSPKQKDWQDVKNKEEPKKGPSKLDLVRAKLAEATKGKDKDRLGRPLTFAKSPSVERRRTISGDQDTDLRPEADDEVNKETISLILSQAKEHFKDGKMDKTQYNTLMYQVMQLNEKLKLKEAKQKESLEVSKRKLHRVNLNEDGSKKLPSEHNRFGDIDERVPLFLDAPNIKPERVLSDDAMEDCDMRVQNGPALLPRPPMPQMFMGPYQPQWRGMRPRGDDFIGSRRPRGPNPPYYRLQFDARIPRPQFEPRPQFVAPIPPKIGMCQGECPLVPYERSTSPQPLGTPTQIPSTDIKVLEYVDQDPMKTIEIDGVPREIRYYGETAIIMLDWDDPREIKFLPGARRITFDNKDSVVLKFNDDYEKVEIDEQVFDIRLGAPTRELFINGRWYECFFGTPPTALLIDGTVRMIQLDGPPPQVDIGKLKRTDLIAGKVNLIIDAQHMCAVFLDAKVQKFMINGQFFTIRFVDSLKTVLINEEPFKVEFGGLPKPIFIGPNKHFIRFSVLPRGVKPGQIRIANMEGRLPAVPGAPEVVDHNAAGMETEELPRPDKLGSPDGESNQGGLDMLASVMPSPMAPASGGSGYSLAEPLLPQPGGIPGLDSHVAKPEEPPASSVTSIPGLGNLNVNDLFAKLVATGIVNVQADTKEDKKEDKAQEDKNTVHRVDLLRPETLRGKQPGIVTALYSGMQCSGCGTRFPPEHTTRYSAHLDWHFRQNRRDRDSARRAHSRRWHYDLADWCNYEELDDVEEKEKSWFECVGGGAPSEDVPPAPPARATTPPSAPAAAAPATQLCALCGDRFNMFYNEDKEEWHLRQAIAHEGNNYHPMCFEDYKASQAKQQSAPDESSDDVVALDKTEADAEPIEIQDGDADAEGDNDNDDVVVLEKDESQEPVEIDEGDEDDVICAAPPLEQVEVQDDADTDDETQAARAGRDERARADYSSVRVKQEPVDPDDEPVITAEERAMSAAPDVTSAAVTSSIDGNVEPHRAPAPAPAPANIRINISKTMPSRRSPLPAPELPDEEPPPPGDEPQLEFTVKPTLEGVEFIQQPPVQRGAEMSGLCSIM